MNYQDEKNKGINADGIPEFPACIVKKMTLFNNKFGYGGSCSPHKDIKEFLLVSPFKGIIV
jgi:hypothetical protein